MNTPTDWLKVSHAYHCATHGWWDAKRESGCPTCIIEMRRELTALRVENQELRRLLDRGTPISEYERRQSERAGEAEAELARLRDKLAESERRLDDAESKLAGLADTIAAARRNVNPFDSPNIDYMGDMREHVWELSYGAARYKNENATLRDKLAERDGYVCELERELAALREKLAEVERERNALELEAAFTRTAYNQLKMNAVMQEVHEIDHN